MGFLHEPGFNGFWDVPLRSFQEEPCGGPSWDLMTSLTKENPGLPTLYSTPIDAENQTLRRMDNSFLDSLKENISKENCSIHMLFPGWFPLY